MDRTPESILKDVFGYARFKPLQREVIASVLERRDALAVMPTGGGKSLCYQVPALIFEGLTVVVSPLIALMKDQVEQLHELGISALFLNSSLAPDEYRRNMDDVRRGDVKLLYVAPETLLTQRVQALLAKTPVDCLAIDEAHCISEWGHDFRPEYRQLAEVRRRLPGAVCLALTATATPRVRDDITKSLGFAGGARFVASFNRENLYLEVAPKIDAQAQVLDVLKRFEGQSGIIYCFARKQVDSLAAFLAGKGFAVRPYHAGLEDDERRRNQEAFIRDDVQIIVATIAFGMGINKPNVRFVIHHDLPKSLESYYQEVGRAGRDGLPAHCLLLYSYGDVQKLRYFLDQKPDDTERRAAYLHLDAMVRYAELATGCRRGPLLTHFGEAYSAPSCDACDNCSADAPALVDVTVPAQKFLSCVHRTGGRFGANHIVDVLLGSKNEKVLKFGHDRVSTYGIGRELARTQWLHLGRQLVQQGLLVEDEPPYRTLALSPRGYEVLRARQPIQGVIAEARERPARPSKAAAPVEHDRDLFDRLRAWRKDLADSAGVPPYVIFSDRTLIEMAAYLPRTMDDLLDINGVGQVKAQRYGGAFLAIIADHCKKHGLPDAPGPRPEPARPPRAESGGLPPRTREVGEAYNAGATLGELKDRHGVQLDTILEHLTRYALAGNPLRPGGDFRALSLLAPDRQRAALEAFAEAGVEYLRPAFERLGGAVPYDELRIMRLAYLAERPPDRAAAS